MLWTEPEDAPSIGDWHDLAWLLVGGAMVILLVSSQWAPLVLPLAVTSGVAIVGLVAMVNTMLVVMLWRREGEFQRRREVVVPILAGVALAMGELALVGVGRAAVEAWLGWSF
jgi:hypothetical protein